MGSKYMGGCRMEKTRRHPIKGEMVCNFDETALKTGVLYRVLFHCSGQIRENDVDDLRARVEASLPEPNFKIVSTRIPKNSDMFVVTFKYIGDQGLNNGTLGFALTTTLVVSLVVGAILMTFMLRTKSADWYKIIDMPGEITKSLKWVAIAAIVLAVPVTIYLIANNVKLPKFKKLKKA